jgi:hypothetical protein
MAAPDTAALAQVVTAQGKLLQALVTLLALREPHLLGELRTVFAVAQEEAVGPADAAVWALLHRELDTITRVLADPDEAHAEPEPRSFG